MGKNPDYRNGICTNDKSLLEVYATPILVMGSVMELSKSLLPLQSKYPRPMGKILIIVMGFVHTFSLLECALGV